MDKPVIAVIAPGAMGAAVGARLVAHGLVVLTSLASRSAASAQRAAAAGLRAVADAEIASADVILSIVPPGEAVALAERLAPVLRGAGRKPLYVDCNAVNPQTVARIAEPVGAAGCAFVNGAIIGAPPRPGSEGPRFYVCGPHAGRAASLRDFGLRTAIVDGGTGAASALKMCYGGLNKGITALAAAMTLAADRAGVGEAFRAELALSQPALLAQLTRAIPDMFPKAYRWVAEMEEVSGFVEGRPEAGVFQGVAAVYERLAQDVAGDKKEVARLGAFFAAPAAAQKS